MTGAFHRSVPTTRVVRLPAGGKIVHVPTEGFCGHTGKHRYRSRRLALQEVAIAKRVSQAADPDGRMIAWTIRSVYKCRTCRSWHTTSLDPQPPGFGPVKGQGPEDQ